MARMIPRMMYGTAWKEDETERLVALALQCGFRAIDTANQRKHYHEAGVGEALAKAFAAGLKREELFLQTKFTHRGGQDHRLPYDPKADIETQVRQSIDSSLQHLHTNYLDSYVLHGPSTRTGFGELDRRVWRTMEELVRSGKTKHLGISNIELGQLSELVQFASIKPRFVQNRCYAIDNWDGAIRKFCQDHQIVYQGFSLLTANPRVVSSPALARLATARKKTPAQLVFAYCIHRLGILPLTGTSDETHMKQDLEACDLQLDDQEVGAFKNPK